MKTNLLIFVAVLAIGIMIFLTTFYFVPINHTVTQTGTIQTGGSGQVVMCEYNFLKVNIGCIYINLQRTETSV